MLRLLSYASIVTTVIGALLGDQNLQLTEPVLSPGRPSVDLGQ